MNTILEDNPILTALRDFVIVKPVYQDRVGRVIIPDMPVSGIKDSRTGRFRLYDGFIYGEVVSVGKEYKETFDGRQLQAGDKIVWTRHEGIKFTYERQEYIKLKARWVLGVIAGEGNA